MNMIRSLFIGTAIAALLSACGSYQSTTQVDAVSYIQFSGEPNKEQVSIDGTHAGTLGEDLESFDENDKTITRIQVQPGTHDVVVTRDGKEIVKRRIYISDGNSAEVNLP